MSIKQGLFTSEAVSAGHPDKLCDRISDAILDEFLLRDPDARVACETFAANDKILVAGEFRTQDPAHFHEVEALVPTLIRRLLRDTGYSSSELDIDPDTCQIEVRFNHQSTQIASAVDQHEALGAGDQGMMFGYACDETPELMPLAWSLATRLIATGTELVHATKPLLRADGKSQVTIRYENGRPVGVQCVVLSWQHQPEVSLEALRTYLQREVVDKVIPPTIRTRDFRCLLNPAGSWTIGGPKGDTGLTGRKIIVDTYGGSCPHGGGAFSGKDPSKVDRSGAYAARWVAKNIVAAGLARRCTVQLAYAIGYPHPVSVNVDTHGTGTHSEGWLAALVEQAFDLSPAGIIKSLDLHKPIYRETAVLGHFGRWRQHASWESTHVLATKQRWTLTKERFLERQWSKGLASPEAHDWSRFTRHLQRSARFLPTERLLNPLILGGDIASPAEKHARLGEQLNWAEAHQCLDEALEFLLRLPDDAWTPSGATRPARADLYS